MRTQIGTGYPHKYLDIRDVESNNTMLFDYQSASSAVDCTNLTVAQVRKIHAEMSKFLDRQPVTVTVTGPKSAIENLRNDKALKVTDDTEW